MDWEREALRLKGLYDDACDFIEELLLGDLIPEDLVDDAKAVTGGKF